MENKNWLPHLTNEMMVGARNNNLCSYAIALEGWRRGLELKFYSKKVKQNRLHVPGCLFSLSDGKKTHMFYKSKGERVKREAFSIGDNKYKSKKVLEKNGVPVPKGEIFAKDVPHEEIIRYAEEIGYPVVLKPSAAAQGKGVIANIDNEEFLRKSLVHIREELNYPEVILEEHVNGEEYRVYVMEDEVIAVLNRIPANIVGNGKSTIKELIRKKNAERKKNPRLFSCLIKIDYEIKNRLEKEGKTLDTVPANGEIVYLRHKSNITSGGDSVDVTDEFPEEVKKVAIEALKAIPNFPNGGVDVMVDFSKPMEDAARIIELTPVPQIGSILFPMKGKSRDVPAAIIDYYFPETKALRNNHPNIYFYLPEILAPLMSKAAKEVTVIPCPDHMQVQRKYKIEGTVQKVGFRRWIRKKALEADLYGYAENQLDGSLIVAVAGTNEAVGSFEKTCKQGPKKANVTSVTVHEWEGAIRVGFEIKPNPKKSPKKKVAQNKQKKPIATVSSKKKSDSKLVVFLKKGKRRVTNLIERKFVKSTIQKYERTKSKETLLAGLKKYPKNTELLHKMANHEFENEEFKSAIKYWAKLKNMTNATDYVHYALALEETNQNAKALKVLQKGEQKYPENQLILTSLLKYYAKLKDDKKVMVYYPKVLDDRKKAINYDLMKNIYEAYFYNGFSEKAYLILKSMMCQFPQKKELIEYDIKQSLLNGEWDHAIEVAKEISDDFERQIMTSMIYKAEGKHNQFQKIFDKAIEQYPLNIASDKLGYRKIVLFDNGESRIEYYKRLKKTNRVIVTFDAINMVWEGPSFGFRLLSKEDLDIIAIRKRTEQTYQQDLSQEDFVRVVKPLLNGYKDKMSYGFSLGAYQTLYYSSLLNCRILAMAPRLSIHPTYGRRKIIPKFKMLQNEEMPKNNTIKPIIVYDPKNALDNKYIMEGILPYFPNTQLIELPYAGHSIAPYLKDTGQLKDFVYKFINGETPVFERRNKHKSPQYYINLAAACYQHKKYKWALNIVNLGLEECPKNVSAIKTKIKALKALNHLEEALEFAEKASLSLNDILDLKLYVVDLYQETNNEEEALRLLKLCEKQFGLTQSIKKRYPK